MPELTVTSRVLDAINTLVIELHGDNRYSVSKVNAGKLVERVAREGRSGVVIDYRDCVLGHQMARDLQFAYVFADAQVAHIILMTRALKAAGIRASGFPDLESACQWIEAGQAEASDIGTDTARPTA